MDWFLLAQAEPQTVSWVNAVSGVASVGIAVWFVYYKTTIADPKEREQNRLQIEQMQKDHRDERRAEAETNRTTLANLMSANQTMTNAMTARFDSLLKEQRDEHREDLKTFWAELAAEREARRQDTSEITEAIAKLMK